MGQMIGIGTLLLAGLAAAPDLTPGERAELGRTLANRNREFDARENLLKTHIGGAYSYNTNLRDTDAHPTRESLVYAADLLALGRDEDRPRALAVLGRVLDLQDRDPESRSFGVWPYLLEEPLGKGPYIDRNWADFLGVQLLRVWIDSRDALPPEMVARLEAGIRNAAEAIRVRNVGPGYTNIAVMSTYVTIIAGERLSDLEILARGLRRLDDLVEHTRKNRDSLTEYNSPTYTKVAVEELARLRHHIRTPEARPGVEYLYRVAWNEIASHFHANSGQWAGPNSRSYGDLIKEGLREQLNARASGRLVLRHQGVPMPCPDDLLPLFDPIELPRTVVKAFEGGDHPITGTTYLDPRFALGSINRQDTWNQRRNLEAHFGTPERPGYARFRLLHDGYDFASGHFWSAQDAGRVLAGVTLATDGGDKHPSLDRVKDRTIRASDLRVRFEIGGPAAKSVAVMPVSSRNGAVRVDLGDGLLLRIHALLARFDGQDGRWEIGSDRDARTIDLVLMHGPERAVKLDEIEEFVAVVGVALGDDDEKSEEGPPSIERDGNVVRARWSGLNVVVPTKPAPRRALIQAARGPG